MREGPQTPGLLGDKPQQLDNADAWQLVVERAVDRGLFARVAQRPASFLGDTSDLDVGVGAVLNALIDRRELGVEGLAQRREGLVDRRQQQGRPDLAQHRVLMLPAGLADQVVLETAELRTVPYIHIAGLKGVAQQTIHQKLIPVDLEAFWGAGSAPGGEKVGVQ